MKLKNGLVALLLMVFSGHLLAQDGTPDILAFSPSNKENNVKITKEDSNYVYYKPFKDAPEQKKAWSQVTKIQYGEMTRDMQFAEQDFEGGSWANAMKSYQKVIKDNLARSWEKDKAEYNTGVCLLELGKANDAKAALEKITNSSRWFVPSKLKVIDTLPDDKKIQAIVDLIKSNTIKGPFLNDLQFMLLERQIAEELAGDANKTFSAINSSLSGDAMYQDTLADYQIKVDVLNKNYSKAEAKIKEMINAKKETAPMRIALGDIYYAGNKKEDALFEYLRAKLDFGTNYGESSYKAGKAFIELYTSDREQNKMYRLYAKRELRDAEGSDDEVWAGKAKHLLGQIDKYK